MSRFSPIGQGTTLEPINWGDPGDHRNRANADPYAKRLPAFRPDASAQTAKAPAKPMATAPVAPKATAAELVAKAKAEARATVVAVKASPAYKGREATARNLLLSGKHSAAEIIKTLAAEPLDVQMAAVERHLKAKAVDGVWSRAYGTQKAPKASQHKPEPVSKASEYDDIWERAYSKPKIAPGNPA